jgi:hypothetical protein
MKLRALPLAAVGAVAAFAISQTWGLASGNAALQYDEIVRVAMPPASPAPPGAFQTDYATIMGGRQSTVGATSSPTPPPKRGLFSSISQIMSGSGPGAGANVMNAMAQFQQGHLTRYTHYKNWLRVDDPVAQTATIEKCDQHQFISLDLAHRTYSITSTLPTAACHTPAMPMGPRGTVVENEAPGTGDITLSMTNAGLGPQTLDGIATNGYTRSFEYRSTNSTGSCKDGDFKMMTTSYVSTIAIPRLFCPMPKVMGVPSSPTSYVVHGGCKPRMHGALQSAAGNAFGSMDSRFLTMYLSTSFGAGSSSGGGPPGAMRGFGTVTERGNVKWLDDAAAQALFSVPAGFTKQ